MKQEYKDDCPEYLEKFLNYINIVRNLSDRTTEGYYIDLRCFLRYLKLKNRLADRDAKWEEIAVGDTPFEIVRNFNLYGAYVYMKWLAEVRRNNETTRARKTSALREFYRYLSQKSGLMTENPIAELELPNKRKALPKYMTLMESKSFLSKIEEDSQLRDYCIMTIFLNCGLRLAELCGLDLTDISFENKTMRVLGKGGKERMVYLNDACISAISDYIKVRPDADTKALFLSNRKTRISRRRVQELTEKYVREAGLTNKGITTHKLRHTAATLMYQYGGCDTLVLKDVLGHKSVATTEIYTHLSSENLRAAADANPLSKVKKK